MLSSCAALVPPTGCLGKVPLPSLPPPFAQPWTWPKERQSMKTGPMRWAGTRKRSPVYGIRRVQLEPTQPSSSSSYSPLSCLCLCTESWGLIHRFFFFIYLFFKYKFIYFNWRLITLQYCIGFANTSTWIRHRCTHVPRPEPPSLLLPQTLPLGHPSAPTLSILYHASNLDWWFVSHILYILLQGVFPTQGSNSHLLCLLHCRLILKHHTIQETPKFQLCKS